MADKRDCDAIYPGVAAAPVVCRKSSCYNESTLSCRQKGEKHVHLYYVLGHKFPRDILPDNETTKFGRGRYTPVFIF
jgi:hypothetical protein